MPGRHQVVGVDGSAGAERALAWAAATAATFGPIRPVVAWQTPWWTVAPAGPGLAPMLPPDDELAAAATRPALALLDAVPDDVVLELTSVHGAAGPALVAATTPDTSLLVVGTRGHGAVIGGLLGSVSHHCAHHATVPVAIVPADAPLDDPLGRCIVGVDGSDNAAKALAWALRSTPRETVVEAVTAWDPAATTLAEVAGLADETLQAQAERLLQSAIDAALADPAAAGRVVEQRVVRGDARRHLDELGRAGGLVVLGARGRGGLAHLVLGSVTTSLVNHPPGPVVVVR